MRKRKIKIKIDNESTLLNIDKGISKLDVMLGVIVLDIDRKVK